jgi:uncharacterized membrane protein SpoIIM required for sporulation
LNLDRFLLERSQSWQELEGLVKRARRRPARLGPDGVLRLGSAYRAAAADLALARRAFPGDPVVDRLEQLVGRARSLVYEAPTRRGSIRTFFAREYWRLVAERPLALTAAALLLFAPAALSGTWAARDPGAAAGLVPEQFQPATESERPWRELTPGEQADFTTTVFTNNIRVTLVAFAGGVTFGLLTAAILVFNGVILGAVGGLMIGAGNGVGFVELATAHGVLELTCVVVGGAAGLRLGWAIVEPGTSTRTQSAAREGRRTVALALGTAPWLVAAGIVEGYRAQLAEAGVPVVVGVGLALGAIFWGLVLWRGREPRTRGARGAWLADTP